MRRVSSLALAPFVFVVVGMALVLIPQTAQAAVDCASLPQVGAHRGAPVAGSGLTENGMSAFRAAMANGAAYIETDLRHTADHHIVVMHDATLDRTTNLTGTVASKTLAQIRAGHLDDGEPIPTAATLFAWMRNAGVRGDLEQKNLGPAAMSLEVKMLGSYHLASRVHITSLRTTQLDAFRALTSNYVTVYIGRSTTTVATAQRYGTEVQLMYGAPIGDYVAAGMTVEAGATGTEQWDAVNAYPVVAVDTNDVLGLKAYLTAACGQGGNLRSQVSGKGYPYSTAATD
jgi:glycerophosphoryl diester phosphodiesterase